MTCEETREHFSDRIDGVLDPATEAEVARHLATCPACQHDLARFEQTVAGLHALGDVRAPAGFVDRVLGRARPEPWIRRALRAAFLPLPLKLPLEAAAVAMLGILTVLLYRETPDLQRASDRPSVRDRAAAPATAPPVPPAQPMKEEPSTETGPAAARRAPGETRARLEPVAPPAAHAKTSESYRPPSDAPVARRLESAPGTAVDRPAPAEHAVVPRPAPPAPHASVDRSKSAEPAAGRPPLPPASQTAVDRPASAGRAVAQPPVSPAPVPAPTPARPALAAPAGPAAREEQHTTMPAELDKRKAASGDRTETVLTPERSRVAEVPLRGARPQEPKESTAVQTTVEPSSARRQAPASSGQLRAVAPQVSATAALPILRGVLRVSDRTASERALRDLVGRLGVTAVWDVPEPYALTITASKGVLADLLSGLREMGTLQMESPPDELPDRVTLVLRLTS